MGPTSGARWEWKPSAAGGGSSEADIGQRSQSASEGEARCGDRNPARRDNPEVGGSSPPSATTKYKDQVIDLVFCIYSDILVNSPVSQL